MKIYAYNEITEIMGRANVLSVTDQNIDEVQGALDSDWDNKFKIAVGHALIRDDSRRIYIHSNAKGGYTTYGTTVFGQVV